MATATAGRILPVVLASIALAALWPAFALFNERANTSDKPVVLAPVAVSWSAIPAVTSWTPRFMTPDASLQGAYNIDYPVIMAGATIASVPVLILFVFVQRYIIEGVATSGLKG